MSSKKVLVVDDSLVDLQNLKSILESEGYQVITATSGREAYEKAKANLPGLILMDVVMDDVDGFEACRTITSDKDTGGIPVVFVTSKSQKADLVWGKLQGGKDMISKPYSPEQIINTVNQCAS